MGDGMKRAFAAAAATKPRLPLDGQMTMFLDELARLGGAAKNSHMRLMATREKDRARRKCVKQGLAFYSSPCWHITTAGREALAAKTT